MMPNDRFRLAFDATVAFEGGYSNHPDDAGGPTMHGVTQRMYDSYCDRKGLPRQSVKLLTLGEVQSFYREDYWNAAKLDFVSDPAICMEVFDSAVLHGPVQAVKFLQGAINFLLPPDHALLIVDGDLGPRTRARLISLLPKYRLHLLLCCNGEQYAFLDRLAERKPSQRSFTRGWAKRLQLVVEGKI